MTLTKVQLRVLEFLRSEIRSSGRSPTMREIQAEFGYASPHTPQYHVKKLIEAGYLQRGTSLEFVEQGLRLAGIVAAALFMGAATPLFYELGVEMTYP